MHDESWVILVVIAVFIILAIAIHYFPIIELILLILIVACWLGLI